MNDLYLPQAKEALGVLLRHYGNNKSQFAADLGVTRVAVHNWVRRGFVGKRCALQVDKRSDLPVTKEMLRPDIKIWSCYNYK